jgi:hypothetical protein
MTVKEVIRRERDGKSVLAATLRNAPEKLLEEIVKKLIFEMSGHISGQFAFV